MYNEICLIIELVDIFGEWYRAFLSVIGDPHVHHKAETSER